MLARDYKDPQCVYDARGNGNGELAPTITGDHQNRVTDYTALCVETYQQTTGSLMASGYSKLGTQEAANDMFVVSPCNWDGTQVAPTLTANNANGAQRMPDKINFNAVIEGDGKMNVVRRLTPIECERLQGMPDEWSRYGVDENGNVYELSDSARYKIQGNGIATPFWKWLLERISEECRQQGKEIPTMASLFDGQGSFPMIWESINGKGSALWSSEIDKNAIAVAKAHFPELSD